MGCFCSKHGYGRIFNDMCDLSGPTLISQLHGNATPLLHLYNHSPNKLKIIADFTKDDRGGLRLHQQRELQLIPIEGHKKIFLFRRDGIEQRLVAYEGDVIFVMPFGTTPDVVHIEQGCHLSINKIRILLESIALRLTGGEGSRCWRPQLPPVSLISTRWP